MEVEMKTTVQVSAKSLIDSMSDDELAEFIELVAIRLDEKVSQDFRQRKNLANIFADHTSEIGAKFLAEICASTMYRR